MKLETFPAAKINRESITECTMTNAQMTVSLLSYGASIHSIRIHDHNTDTAAAEHETQPFNITLTLDTVDAYQRNQLYAGATLGPNAGRISGGRLNIPSGVCQLSQNNGCHQLHGGHDNLAFRNWTLEHTGISDESCTVLFSTYLHHGTDGFPGNRRFTVQYTLTKDHRLLIQYRADTDRPTYINMSNHTYFHLGGPFPSIWQHHLQVNASRYAELSPDHIPVRIADCKNSPFDFSSPHSLAEQAKKYPGHPQLKTGHGYNHGFILNRTSPSEQSLLPDLILFEPVSGRRLEVFTDAPCIVIYSGGFIGNQYLLERGIPSVNSCAIAIECQDVPDTPNLCPQKMYLTTPKQPYCRNIEYRFKVPL